MPSPSMSVTKLTLYREIIAVYSEIDRLCGLVVKFLATDTEVPGSIPGATRFSE